MRRYVPSWDSIGIKKDRYFELLHFCRQYPEWKAEAASLLGMVGHGLDGMPHGSSVGDPVANAAERRSGLLAKIDMVDRCARAIDDGLWYTALIQNVCLRKAYSKINPAFLPTSNRAAYFISRKAFFQLLNIEKDKSER